MSYPGKETPRPDLDQLCRCGHHVDAHDAGECWTEPDAVEQSEPGCPCSWYEPTTPSSLDQQIRARLRTSSDNVHLEALIRGEALRFVLDLHRPHHIYDECSHRHTEDEPGAHHVENVGLVCDDGYEYSICWQCCTSGSGYQTEDCVTNHPSCYPCDTVRVIARELGITQEVTR